VLTRLGGRRPLGYRAPAWQLSSATLGLLARHGFDYSSNMMDRLTPYLHPAIEGRALVEIPVSWVLDDAPFFMFTGQRSIQAPGPVLQGWLTEFEGITEARGVTNFTFHPQIIGRPSRLACLRELMDHVRHTPRMWIATLGEISAQVRASETPAPPRP
jgi:peptidoglycan/xylan/chitin deacetylase (PgdA/CDA1 family)